MTSTPPNFTVWAEIPVTDIDCAIIFYNKVFDIDMKTDDSGPNPMAVFPAADPAAAAGHLYPGKPAPAGSGPTVHFACPGTLEDAMERVKDAGGQVLSDAISIPAGRFAYCLDPDGNSIGIFSN